MEPFRFLSGVAAPLDQSHLDTDQILPARFLRLPRSEGYQRFLFRDLRFHEDGSEKSDFILNQPAYREAVILVTGANFGCGSSREQAPWSLLDHGVRCVVAPSFGEIFYLNACKCGLLPVALEEAVCSELRRQLHASPGATMRVDLVQQAVTGPDGSIHPFEIEAARKHRLVEGLDDIDFTLQNDAQMRRFELSYRSRFDWLFPDSATPPPGIEIEKM